MFLPDYQTIKFEQQERIDKAANIRRGSALRTDLKLAQQTELLASRRRKLARVRARSDRAVRLFRRRRSLA